MCRLLFTGVALLAFATPGHARSMSYVCDGTITRYTLSAYAAITGKDSEDVCVFITNSAEGRKILQVCPMGSQCSEEGMVNNTGSANELYKVVSVHRTGTPALDAKAKKDKEAEDQRRRASVRPFAEKTTDCVVGHIKGEVSEDAVKNVMDKFCTRERDALLAEYSKHFGPGGRYLYMNYSSELPQIVEGVRDWRDGLCFRARPYLLGPPEKEAAWMRGWEDAKRRNPNPVDRSHCFPGR